MENGSTDRIRSYNNRLLFTHRRSNNAATNRIAHTVASKGRRKCNEKSSRNSSVCFNGGIGSRGSGRLAMNDI